VNQENPTALEPNNQILAATVQRSDALAGELGRHLGRILGARQAWVGDVDVLEAAPDEHRLETAPDRLDLGQLGHRPSLAMTVIVGGHAVGLAE
jgi:hypothetical protein